MNWSKIAVEFEKLTPPLNRRNGRQCRERYLNHLHPKIDKEAWSIEEVTIILNAQKKYGNRWVKIAKLLPRRTNGSIKNYFHSLVRKGIR